MAATCRCRRTRAALAAGLDLLAAVPADAPVTLAPGARAIVPTGLAIALPAGHRRLRCGRAPGLRGEARRHRAEFAGHDRCGLSRREFSVILINHGAEPFAVTRGMRIAQLVIARVEQATFHEVASLDDTARGSGGFGSTGGGRA